MKKRFLLHGILLTILLFSLFSCTKKEEIVEPIPVVEDTFIRAADISFLPLFEKENVVFYNETNQPENVLTTLKNAGCNTIRIRLWKNPTVNQSTFQEVKAFSQRIKQAGLKVWLSVHYSDTWADPAHQSTPLEWQNLPFEELKMYLNTYTSQVVTEIQPDIMQIGNEINSGFIWPNGNLITNENQFLELVASASATIRNKAPKTKIMLHYAGINSGTNSGATWFFNKVRFIDYDYIGLSYYPIWHGKNLSEVKTTINTLGQTHNKKVVIAETAYPFTFTWNDWTNNILGLENQIIPSFAATPQGQKNYLIALKTTIKDTQFGQGFCYWEPSWIAFRGLEATNGSSWENQALWDFNHKVLPSIEVFKK
jgi:arabinogalactan endo-1,4-beta-galactosidase